jgi:SAM-dependent methyltransferase
MLGALGAAVRSSLLRAHRVEMVAAAGRASGRLGLVNVEHHEMDAERMDLGDDSADGVLCRWGYMLMADTATALADRRVLRHGGRLSLSVWGAVERNPWATLPAKALMEHTGASSPNPEDPPHARGRATAGPSTYTTATPDVGTKRGGLDVAQAASLDDATRPR